MKPFHRADPTKLGPTDRKPVAIYREGSTMVVRTKFAEYVIAPRKDK